MVQTEATFVVDRGSVYPEYRLCFFRNPSRAKHGIVGRDMK